MKRMSSCHKDGSIIISMCSIISTIFLLQSKNQAELKSKKNWCSSILFGLQHFFSWELHNSTIYVAQFTCMYSSTILENLSRKLFSIDPKFKASGDKKRCHFWLSIIEAGDLGHNKTIWISTCRLSNHLFTTYNVVITCNRGDGFRYLVKTIYMQ